MASVLSILIYIGLFYLMFRFGCGSHAGHHRHGGHEIENGNGSREGNRTREVMSASTDPVCGMAVSENDGYSRRLNGHTYRFCSKSCLDRFESEPGRYSAEERIAS